MSYRELVTLLEELLTLHEWPDETRLRLQRALGFVKRRQTNAHRRHVFFRLRADEQRELLR
jgi:hypothetical protein